MTNRSIHTAEFKRDAVQLTRTGGNLSGTARDLGIKVSLLRILATQSPKVDESSRPPAV